MRRLRTAEETARTNNFRVSINKFSFLYRRASEAFHESRFGDVTWISLSNICVKADSHNISTSFVDGWSARKTSSISFKTSISNRSKLFSIESQIHAVTRADAFLLLVSHKFEITYM